MKRVRILRDTSGASIVIALVFFLICGIVGSVVMLSLIHISEPTRQAEISYAVFCLKKKKQY